MARIKTTHPNPSRQKGQRSQSLPLYINRNFPVWSNPKWLNAEVWRQIVQKQPFAMISKETLIANLESLDWKIEPRDSTKRDEYKDEIDYYTKFFEYTGDYDYSEVIEWIGADLLDIPFGAAVELGREGDSPDGKLLWLELLDGATLFPTLNNDFPVGQYLKELGTKTIYFPKHAINRMYYSPRREIKRKGWGMAPPEMIYLAIELMNRGDVYYANLLLDTPAAGILDLGDMSKESAEEWVTAWREMLGGTDPFKIPVLYEHENQTNWIPFTKSPVELMFDKATFKYASLVTAGYGITLSDIGFSGGGSSGGETLAGTIRSERKTRRTGFARIKKKTRYFFDRMLPEYLQFKFIDLDDELNVALGRARLATSTAWGQMVGAGMFTPEEGRQQMIADGLITISVPESLPEGAFPTLDGNNAERPNQLGRPVSPSDGGHGEIKEKSDAVTTAIYRAKFTDGVLLERLAFSIFPIIRTEIEAMGDESEYSWLDWHNEILFGKSLIKVPDLTRTVIHNSTSLLEASLDASYIKLFEIEKESALIDVKEIVKDLYGGLMQEETRKSYVRGDINEISDEIIEEELLDLEDDLIDLIDTFELEARTKLSNAVISGVYRFAVMNQQVDNIVEEAHPNLLLFIRSAIDDVCDILLSEFGGKISDIIRTKLEKE